LLEQENNIYKEKREELLEESQKLQKQEVMSKELKEKLQELQPKLQELLKDFKD